MRILSIDETPFWEIPYLTAGMGGRVEDAALPLLRGTVDTLPPDLDALLACSDLQGRGPAQPSTRMPRLLGEILAADLELLAAADEIPPARCIGVLLLGDFYAGAGALIRGAHGDVRPVWQAFADRCRWVVGVAGNHDEIDDPPVSGRDTAHLLDGTAITLDDLRIAGVSGVIGAAKSGRAWRRDEAEFVRVLRTALRAGPDVLLLHQGPDGDTPDQPGHPAIRTALAGFPPVLALCGHVHWPSPLATLSNGGQILNVEGRAILFQSSKSG